ncbi:hypothetical protein CNR22_15805 [Sphingobacteriaceae bacterium]|nr:hypothetical protein CNR22_15805 [Sphingobacteriaceae bacterium]
MGKFFYIAFLILLLNTVYSQNQDILLRGSVKDENSKEALQGATVRLSGSPFTAPTNTRGEFSLRLPPKEIYKLTISHYGYTTLLKDLKRENQDTVDFVFYLAVKAFPLDTVPIFAKQVPETLVGKPNYSVYDFDFYEDKLILLTSETSLDKAQLQLSNYQGKIFSYFKLPKGSGIAKNFFHDYQGYTELMCKDSIFRLDVFNNDLIVGGVPRTEFERYVKPIADTLRENMYYSNQWDKYPSFNYYYLKANDTVSHVLNNITNEDLMKLYNFEYYYLPTAARLEARRMADYYKTDKHIMAALMSGFTNSMFYEPLYAPLFIIRDTICIFNHHNDFLYHYDKQNKLIDSVKINYHHPKNWREWKKQLFVDEPENKVYAFFSKDGHHYLKQINHQTGKEVLTYKLQHHSAEKIKIKDGFVYYVYRPFGSTQEKFLYREKIH